MTPEEIGCLIATELLNGMALCGKLTDKEAVCFTEEVIDAVAKRLPKETNEVRK
jgi:hypothetical protein